MLDQVFFSGIVGSSLYLHSSLLRWIIAYMAHFSLLLYLWSFLSSFFKLLGVIIDGKLTFEKHIRNIASSIAQKLVLLANVIRLLAIMMQTLKSFYAFILPCFEYCSPVWCSASDSHLKLLDHALKIILFYSFFWTSWLT